jgi:hypothetical protein
MNTMPGVKKYMRYACGSSLAILIILLATPVHAKPNKNIPFRAYVSGQAGWGNLAANIYGDLIDDSFYRYGGGFGIEYGKYNAEVLYRTGTDSWRSGMAITGYQGPLVSDGRNFRIQEIQLKAGFSPLTGRIRTPAGLIVTYTTFSSSTLLNVPYAVETSGWTIGTFMGAELSVASWVAFGIEVQYNLGLQNGRPGPADFYYNRSRNPELLTDLPFSTVPPGMSYFDNAGFFNTGTENGWSRGGYLIQVKTMFFLPEFRAGE